MIDVFETWFIQFTKAEQMKLLKHIKKNHFDLNDEYSSRPSDRIDKRLKSGSISSSRQIVSSTVRNFDK